MSIDYENPSLQSIQITPEANDTKLPEKMYREEPSDEEYLKLIRASFHTDDDPTLLKYLNNEIK